MPKPREELRRGLRDLIERTSREMEALGDPSSGDVAPDETPHGAAPPGTAPDAVVAEPAHASDGTQTSQTGSTTDAVPSASTSDPSSRPMLRLVRNTVRTLIGTREAPAPTVAPTPPPSEPTREPAGATRGPETVDADALHPGVHRRRGVCESYYINHECWKVPDAFCNHALHTCMLRDCPVYNLHREELEKRFASKYAHLW